MADRIQLRRDTDTNWASVDPVLADGEPAYDKTNGLLKIGDGSTAFSALAALTPNLAPYALLAGAAFTGQVTLAQGTLVDPEPFSITQTWNDAADTFKAIEVNITDTASAAASLLMDMRVGGVSKFSVDKAGVLSLGGASIFKQVASNFVEAVTGFSMSAGASTGVSMQSTGLFVGPAGLIGFTPSNGVSERDTILARDAANTLAQRNGVNAQTFRVYNTYTDASNYARLALETGSGYSLVGNQNAGTGPFDALFVVGNAIRFQTGASYAARAERWRILDTGHFIAAVDNTYDIGASGLNRPRTGYFGTSLVSPIAVFSGQSLTGSQATSLLDMATTWNTTGAPTAIKLNVTNTASAAASSLMDLQVGGVSNFRFVPAGQSRFIFTGDGNGTVIQNGQNQQLLISTAAGAYKFGFSSSGFFIGGDSPGGAGSSVLTSDGSHALAQRYGTNAQAFRLYNTYTDASNYERGFMRWASNELQIGAEAAGTGTARALVFKTDGTTRFTISASSNLVSLPAGATIAFGTGGIVRLRYINSADNAVTMFDLPDGGTGIATFALGTTNPLFRFGGTTSAFPALKRSSTVLQSRLADDSDFAPLQGQLRVHANAAAETPTATHTMRVFDAAGTEYKVLCVAA